MRVDKAPEIEKVSSMYDLVHLMKTILFEICKNHFENQALDKDSYVSEAIVCGLEKITTGEPIVYRIMHTGYCEQIPIASEVPYYAAGHAGAYAYSLMKLFYRQDIDENQMIELISYIIHQTGLADTSVGGNPQVVIIEKDKSPRELSSRDVGQTVDRVAFLSSSLNQILRGLFQEKEMYKAVESYLLEDMGGIVKNNRKFSITLKHCRVSECDLILGEEFSQYDARNDSDETKELFLVEGEPHIVSRGNVTIPEPLKQTKIPKDVNIFWDLLQGKAPEGLPTGLRIDGRDVQPIKTLNFVDRRDLAKGVFYSVEAHQKIESQQTMKVEQASKCLFDNHDYIIKKLSNYGTDVEVTVNKPKDLEVSMGWFLTAKGTRPAGTKWRIVADTGKCHSEKVEGVIVPGNGFVVMWWPKRKRRLSGAPH
jgi:predicted proteasome-type protease